MSSTSHQRTSSSSLRYISWCDTLFTHTILNSFFNYVWKDQAVSPHSPGSKKRDETPSILIFYASYHLSLEFRIICCCCSPPPPFFLLCVVSKQSLLYINKNCVSISQENIIIFYEESVSTPTHIPALITLPYEYPYAVSSILSSISKTGTTVPITHFQQHTYIFQNTRLIIRVHSNTEYCVVEGNKQIVRRDRIEKKRQRNDVESSAAVTPYVIFQSAIHTHIIDIHTTYNPKPNPLYLFIHTYPASHTHSS